MSKEGGNRRHSGSSALLMAVSWNSPEVHTKHIGPSSPLNKPSLKRDKRVWQASASQAEYECVVRPSLCPDVGLTSYIRLRITALLWTPCQNSLFTDSVEEVVTFRGFFTKRALFSCFCHWQAQALRRSTLFLPIGVSPGIRLAWT